ncbi:MAG: Flp pilus assembly complex ATPase component TadA [Oscillospiraceae bacterium]|nr:Flp pilus assembly complex ATPase component TadA [Oscillospiraceae bacterium]
MTVRENNFISAISPLPENIRSQLKSQSPEIIKKASEIRLRAGRPILLTGGGKDFPLYSFGQAIIARKEDVLETFRNICEHSLYSHEEELKNGYITFKGGHRAGICGTAFSKEGKVAAVRDISSICIRIAGNEENAAGEIFDKVFYKDGSIMIAGPPGSGKTTILRDFARKAGKSVAVVDERLELSGKTSEDILLADADIFSGYPKPQGIEIATRCFAPKIIICDEISPNDTDALLNALFSGVRLITSVHAGNKKELFSRPFLNRIFASGAFKTVVLLKGSSTPGEVEEIIDLEGKN